jgi:hypothetical protein
MALSDPCPEISYRRADRCADCLLAHRSLPPCVASWLRAPEPQLREPATVIRLFPRLPTAA